MLEMLWIRQQRKIVNKSAATADYIFENKRDNGNSF